MKYLTIFSVETPNPDAEVVTIEYLKMAIASIDPQYDHYEVHLACGPNWNLAPLQAATLIPHDGALYLAGDVPDDEEGEEDDEAVHAAIGEEVVGEVVEGESTVVEDDLEVLGDTCGWPNEIPPEGAEDAA